MSTTAGGAPAAVAWRPSSSQVVTFLQAMAVYGETERFRQLDRREAFFRCLAYAHQPFDWWGRNADQTETISTRAIMPPSFVPAGASGAMLVRDKRPTAPTNLARTTIKRYTGLLFSEARKPRVLVEQDPDTEAFLTAVRDASKFWPVMRAARDKGGAMGSVAVTVHLREGRFSYEVHNSKNCTPLWADKRTWRLGGLLIMWKYPKEEDVKDKDGKLVGTRVVEYLYRRIITDQEDTIYKDVRLEDAGVVGWEPEPALSVKHELGFFPGVWIQNHSESDDMDGDPDCEGAWQTIDTDDRLIAQMNKGVLNNLDPTLVTATDPKETEQGMDVAKGSDYAIEVGKSGRAQYLEMTGAGIEIGLKVHDLFKQNVCDMTGLVLLDDRDLAAAQSAKAIEFRFAPMIERADDLRAQYGEGVVELMKITVELAKKFSGVQFQLADGRTGEFHFALPPRKTQVRKGDTVVDVVTEHKLGKGGYVSLQWGPYFSPTETDNEKTIRNANAANVAGFIDRVSGARAVAPLYNITDVEGTVAKAKQEAEQQTEALLGGGRGVGLDSTNDYDPTPAAGQGGKP